MTGALVSGADDDDSRLEWSEVKQIANDLFHTWGGGDLRWAEAAWQVLSESGLTSYVFEVDRTVCIIRLVALNAFYREFCVRAFDEGSSDDWQYELFELVGGYPLIDAFSLGQLAERRGIFVDNALYQEPDPRTEAIQELARGEYRQVVDALQARWGEHDLFAALWVSPEAKGNLYPLDADLRGEIATMDPPSNMGRAWAWYDDGAGL